MSGSTPAALRLRLHRIEHAARAIHLFEWRDPEGRALPPFTAGAHVDLALPNGLVRSYSLANDPAERHRYVLGVKRDPASRGGSACLHEQVRVGDVLDVQPPRNAFALDEAAPHSVLVAGGIGITPLACMAQRLRALGRPYTLHYAVARRDEAALIDGVDGTELHLHVDADAGGVLDVAGIVAGAPADAVVYGCGPAPMLAAFEAACRARPGLAWRIERFTSDVQAASAGGCTVRLARSGRSVPVPPGQSILDALRAAGVAVVTSCEQGICGTCETRVLGGEPDHRDSLLSDDERRANRSMMICCSGSRSAELVLDL